MRPMPITPPASSYVWGHGGRRLRSVWTARANASVDRLDIGQQQRELLASDPAQDRYRRAERRAPEYARHMAQRHVAELVAEPIVDPLEECQDTTHQRGSGAAQRGQRAYGSFVEPATIKQAGQGVDVRKPIKLVAGKGELRSCLLLRRATTGAKTSASTAAKAKPKRSVASALKERLASPPQSHSSPRRGRGEDETDREQRLDRSPAHHIIVCANGPRHVLGSRGDE